MFRHILDFIKDEDAQSTTEYILILAVVAMIVMRFKGAIGSVIGNLTKKTESAISNDALFNIQ